MEADAFRLAIMDSVLKRYNRYAPLSSAIDKTFSPPDPSSRQAKVSSANASFQFRGVSDTPINDNRAIVHRAGGMLLQSRKELLICADLTDKDVLFYYTTTCVFQP